MKGKNILAAGALLGLVGYGHSKIENLEEQNTAEIAAREKVEGERDDLRSRLAETILFADAEAMELQTHAQDLQAELDELKNGLATVSGEVKRLEEVVRSIKSNVSTLEATNLDAMDEVDRRAAYGQASELFKMYQKLSDDLRLLSMMDLSSIPRFHQIAIREKATQLSYASMDLMPKILDLKLNFMPSFYQPESR